MILLMAITKPTCNQIFYMLIRCFGTFLIVFHFVLLMFDRYICTK